MSEWGRLLRDSEAAAASLGEGAFRCARDSGRHTPVTEMIRRVSEFLA